MIPHYHLHHPPRAITANVVRAHYIQTGGLVIVVVVHQRRHRPPLLPSSPSRGWLLLGAACRHRHPHHCVHRRHNPTNNEITTTSPRPHPPLRPPPPQSPSRPLRPLDRPWRRQRQCPPSRSDAASAAPARAPLVGIRAHCASAAVTLRRPAVYPPSLLGLPPPVGQRRRQHSNVDGCPWQPGATTTTP
jgi:hypothetical protein